jgi:translation initiation factor IF-3
MKLDAPLLNLQITANEIRLITEDGADMGIVTRAAALEFVRKRTQDLVQINPDAQPPVCQAIDYGKYRYRLQRAREDRAHE